MTAPTPFGSFFLGGFEASTHRTAEVSGVERREMGCILRSAAAFAAALWRPHSDRRNRQRGRESSEWLTYITAEARRAREFGIHLQGICWYPFVTSSDWENPTAFFDGGLFDVVPQPDGSLQRVEARPVAYALRQAQSLLDPDNLPGEAREDEPRPTADPLVDVIRPFENSTFKADNFSYRVLIAGDSLLVELYCLEPGASVPAHRDRSTEHVLTVVAGEARIRIGSRWTTVRQSEIVLVPAGLYYGLSNAGAERLIVQQVSGPKPWDARFRGPQPNSCEARREHGQ